MVWLGGEMTHEEKALDVLRAIAQLVADGKSLTLAEDLGFGTATARMVSPRVLRPHWVLLQQVLQEGCS